MAYEYAGEALFIDLADTLVSTDMLHESVGVRVKTPPFSAVGVQERAVAKRNLAQQVQSDLKCLPDSKEILALLREEKRRGRTLVLATASDTVWAQAIVRHVGCFDERLVSHGQRSLKAAP